MSSTLNFVVKIDSNVSEDEWDAQLAKSPYATAFQSAYFFKPNQVAYGSKPIFIKVMDDANNLVGQLSAIINFKEIRTVSNPLSTLLINHFNLGSIIHWKHGPIIHDEKNHLAISKIIFETIDKICHENKINIINEWI